METKELDTSLKKIAKGTGIVLTGTIIGMFLGLASRIIITRYITPYEYGLLSLALTITGIATTIACLGLPTATPRYIAFYEAKKDKAKVWQTIKMSFSFSFIFSMALFFLAFLFADKLAVLFKEPEVAPVIKILSFIIPVRAIIGIIVPIFRGLGDVKPKVYFQDIFPYITKIPLVLVVILFGWAFRGIVYATLFSFVALGFISILYYLKKIPHFIPSQEKIKPSSSKPLAKELILFSLPLFTAIILSIVISSTDTLMLGYFKTAKDVGLYRVAYPLARYISLILSAAGFIYFPIATGLYSGNLTSELKKMYSVTTKWVFSVTLPLFFLVFFAPKPTLYFLFGPNYIQAASALRILALGFFIHTFLGLNGQNLIVLGKAKFIMLNNFVVAILNVLLNLQLIPRFGLEGAAFASFVSLSTGNILASCELYKISGIHPFSKNYLKPVVFSCLLAIAYFLVMHRLTINIYLQVILFAAGFTIISILSIILTKSLDREDLMILRATQQKLNINLPWVERTLKRFI